MTSLEGLVKPSINCIAVLITLPTLTTSDRFLYFFVFFRFIPHFPMSKVGAISGAVADDEISGIIQKAGEMGLSFKEGENITETAMNILKAKAQQMGATTAFSETFVFAFDDAAAKTSANRALSFAVNPNAVSPSVTMSDVERG